MTRPSEIGHIVVPKISFPNGKKLARARLEPENSGPRPKRLAITPYLLETVYVLPPVNLSHLFTTMYVISECMFTSDSVRSHQTVNVHIIDNECSHQTMYDYTRQRNFTKHSEQ